MNAAAADSRAAVAAPGASTTDALSERAAALELESRWPEAEQLLRELFDRALAEGRSELAADAARRQGRSCWLQQRAEEAEELITLGWTIAEACGSGRVAARAVNSLAAIHHSREQYAEAKRLYERAHDMALDANDDVVVGFACQNLGILANIAGELREARTRYLEAIGSTVRSGDTLTAARVYNNLGIVSTDLREWMDAELYFERGLEIVQQTGDLVLTAALHANRAKPLIQVGEYAPALASLAAAEAVAACIHDRGTLSEVETSRGAIARLQGEHDAAREHLERGMEIAAHPGLEREHALALEALAALRWDQGERQEALATLRKAIAAFHSVASQRDAARTERLLASWTRH